MASCKRRRLASMGLLVMITALPGCTELTPGGGYPLSSTVKDCMKQRSPFVDVWGCVQTRYASGQMGDADPRLGKFLKLGDDLAGHVAAKEMTDTDAKTKLSIGAAELDKG